MCDRIIGRIIEMLTAIRNNCYFQKLSVPFSVIAVAIIIYFHFADVSDLYKSGNIPKMGFSGTMLLIFLAFLSYKFESRVLSFRMYGFAMILLPLIFFKVYAYIYATYSGNVFKELMREENVVAGVIYKKKSSLGRGYNHKMIKVGYEYNGVFQSMQSISKGQYKNVNVGDTLILLVSREYPCVMEILLYNPTKEQKERYKIPRKFKSYGYGKIEEEEE